MTKSLLIANPVGFCAGVRHAIDLFRKLQTHTDGHPIYVLHELVHNRGVTDSMKQHGAIFVNDVADVPPGSTILLGAHGCGPGIVAQCQARQLDIHDATCPLVTHLQDQTAACDTSVPLILLGDKAHPEVLGIVDHLHQHTLYLIANEEEAQALPHFDKAVFFSQTTRNISEIARIREILAEHVDQLEDHAHSCNAVTQRQVAMRDIAPHCDIIIIIGSSHSSNARRLAEIARENCRDSTPVCFAESISDLQEDLLQAADTVGLGTATSTPDDIIHAILAKLNSLGFESSSLNTHE